MLRILGTVKSLTNEGTEPTFNAILGELRSERVLSNHTTLRAYLDLLAEAGMLSVRKKAARKPNVRLKQVYSPSSLGPLVEVGEKALLFHGLNWTLPSASSVKERTDIEGLARSRLENGMVYGSLEDAIVACLSGKDVGRLSPRGLTFCAALLATKKIDFEYLTRRARKLGVEETLDELVDEIASTQSSPNPSVQDVRTLFLVRRALTGRFRPPKAPLPGELLLSQEELLDAIGKQLGIK